MSEINVTELRALEAIAPRPNSTTQWVPFVNIDRWQLEALLDAVEALREARHYIDAHAFGDVAWQMDEALAPFKWEEV